MDHGKSPAGGWPDVSFSQASLGRAEGFIGYCFFSHFRGLVFRLIPF